MCYNILEMLLDTLNIPYDVLCHAENEIYIAMQGTPLIVALTGTHIVIRAFEQFYGLSYNPPQSIEIPIMEIDEKLFKDAILIYILSSDFIG